MGECGTDLDEVDFGVMHNDGAMMRFLTFVMAYIVTTVGYWLCQLYVLPRVGLFTLNFGEVAVTVGIVFTVKFVCAILAEIVKSGGDK